MSVSGGPRFNIARSTAIVVSDGSAEVQRIGEALATMLRTPIGFPFAVGTTVAVSVKTTNRLSLAADRADLGDEGYYLKSTPT